MRRMGAIALGLLWCGLTDREWTDRFDVLTPIGGAEEEGSTSDSKLQLKTWTRRQWHKGKHDLRPWTEHFLGVLTAVYRDFEGRVGSLSAARGAKTQLVLDAIRSLPDGFRMVELERACPNVTRDMIRVVINKLKKNGEIFCEGAGAGAVWRKRGNNP